jgi:endo-1,4-beta-xylanase
VLWVAVGLFAGLTQILPVVAAQSEPKAAHWIEPDKSEPAGTRYQTFASKLAKSEVSYLIYLPPDYETAKSRRYPVVYWLHGLGGTQRTGEKFVTPLDAAIRAGKAAAMIAVLVNGMRDSLYCDSADGKIPIESVIVRELIPHVDRTYRTLAGRRTRAVEGFSMGGFGAPHLGFKYPEVFGVVGMMAGVFQDVETVVLPVKPEIGEKMFGGDMPRARAENSAVLLEKNLDAIRGRTVVRICVGDKDPGLARSQAAHEALKRLKVPHEFHAVPGVAHNPEKLYQGLGDDAFLFYLKAFGPEAARKSNKMQ